MPFATNYLIEAVADELGNLFIFNESAGTGSSFTVDTTLADPGSTRFAYRLRAQNAAGLGSYSPWSPWLVLGAPEIGEIEALDVGKGTAVARAFITDTNGAPVLHRGFLFSTNSTFAPGDAGVRSVLESGEFGTGMFTNRLTGLLPGTRYAVRAFAGHASGTNYTAALMLHTDADAALIHRWRMDSNLLDSVGTAHGSTNGSLRFTSGPSQGASALELTGQGYVRTPSVTLPAAFTFAAWVRLAPSASGPQTILGNAGASSAQRGFKCYVNTFPATDGTVVFEQGDGEQGSSDARSIAGGANAGVWRHLVCRVDSTNGLSIFVDGTNVTDGTAPLYAFGRTGPLHIGAMLDPSFLLHGALADVQIYEGLLSDATIAAMSANIGGTELSGISVLGTNGTPILSGADPSTSAGTDFAARPLSSPVEHRMAITNTGEGALGITGWSLAGDASAFAVTGIPAMLQVGERAEISLTFTATGAHLHQATLRITNSAAQPFELHLTGRGYSTTPAIGPAAGGTAILLESAPLGNGADIVEVLIGGNPATISSQQTGRVWFLSPAIGTTGRHDVIVRSVSQGDLLFPDAFTYNPPGSITEVFPNSCTATSGVEIVITGHHLYENRDDLLGVSLCGIEAEILQAADAPGGPQAIIVRAGANGDGIGPVVVRSTLYGTTRLDDAFTYHTAPAAPTWLPVSDQTSGSFTARWSLPPNATNCTLQAAWDAPFTQPVEGYANLSLGLQTSLVIMHDQAGGSVVHLRIRAENHVGTSPWASTTIRVKATAIPWLMMLLN